VREDKLVTQTFRVADSGRAGNTVVFNSSVRSSLRVSEKVLPAFISSTLGFGVTFGEISEFEVGKGEFKMQTMVLDGVKEFVYEVEVRQSPK
jgi:hypothetical protein